MARLDPSLLNQPLRAFIYGRVSSDPKKKGRSVDGQNELNRSTCDENGWTVVGVFRDVNKSASRYARTQRDDYLAMIEAMKRGEADVIVYCDAARGYRDLRTYTDLRDLCEDTGVLLCYNSRVYDMRNASDREHSAQDAVKAEGESKVISDRVNRGMRRAAKLGMPHGRIPYGYRREYDPDDGEFVAQVIYEPEAAVVREIAARIVEGVTNSQIAKDLNDRGVPTPTGIGVWNQSKISRLILKPSYAGLRQYNKEVIGEAVWDAIIEPELYDRCEAILRNPARRMFRDNSVRWLLTGIAVCWCGGPLRVHQNNKITSYQCHGNYHTSIPVVTFDAVVQAEVLARIERPEFARALTASADDDRANAVRNQIADLKETLAEATEATAEGRLSVARLTTLEQKIQPRLEAAEAMLRSLVSDVPGVVHRVAGDQVRQVWEGLGIVAKRQVLRSVTTLIQLNQAPGKGVRKVTPDRYEVRFRW